ncbi:1-acyl-sn-glycerol-3-phosphate acyltransferase [Gemmatimonadota bacterium]
MAQTASFLTRFFGWTAGIFFKVERRGGEVPPGPLLVVANHPNSLMDPLVLFRVLGRPTRPLAKAPLFDQRVLGFILRGMGGLPVYRKQDLPDQMHKNKGTFDAAVVALHHGEAIQVYPEGLSHSEPSLAPLRTGAARIALQAESERKWSLNLQILPVGLTYMRKTVFGGSVVASVGAPIDVARWREAYERDEREAGLALTARIRQGLEAVTLNVGSPEERDLIEVAERVYAREVGLAEWREREALSDRFPRLRYFARGAAWLRNEDPERYRKLAARIRAYERATSILGVGEAEVPPTYELGTSVHYVAREGGILLLELPFAAVGILAWLPVYLVGRFILRRMTPSHEAISTYKFSVHASVAVLTLAGWTLLAWWLGGWAWALGTALLLVPLGLITLAWHRRWTRVEEDVRLFKRVVRRRSRRERLARLREGLVEEFDGIGRALRRAEEAVPADPRHHEPGVGGTG